MPNFKKLLNKKVIFIFTVLVILIGGGLFFWQNNKEIKRSPDDYVIKETAEGIFVENKKAGLVMKVPEGWEGKKMEVDEGIVVFYSPDIKGELKNDKITPPLERGCIIHASVAYEEMDFTYLKLQAKYNLNLLGAKSEKFEETTIKNHKALKVTADTEKIGFGMSVDIPYKNKIYSFIVFSAYGDQEKCIQEFDKFLETISIK